MKENSIRTKGRQALARRFRLWEKKRGDRRTGSKLVGSAGEGMFFATLFLFGIITLAALNSSSYVQVTENGMWNVWVWLVVLVLGSLIVIGAYGLIYTILLIGTSAERRGAIAKQANSFDLLADRRSTPEVFPTVPRDVNLTNSPGIKLKFRLPITKSPGWQLLATGIFALVWNGMLAALSSLAYNKYAAGHPDWYLVTLVVLFSGFGIAALVYLVRLLLLATAIGPTSLEISDHPIYPGKKYQMYLTQAGHLHLKSLTVSLVCSEEATYRQGTDTRTESKQVYSKQVFGRTDFKIEPGVPFEHLCELEFPLDVMHSFQSEHNAVHWKLVVHGSVKKWADFERHFPLVVFPRTRKRIVSENSARP